jgi:hypothetical protein
MVLGLNRNPLVTAAVFETFLGPHTVDDLGKANTGHGLLWCANGFRWVGYPVLRSVVQVTSQDLILGWVRAAFH